LDRATQFNRSVRDQMTLGPGATTDSPGRSLMTTGRPFR
jgi:hypothetical protein